MTRVSCVNIPNRAKLTPYLFQGPCQSLKGNELAQRVTSCLPGCLLGCEMVLQLMGLPALWTLCVSCVQSIMWDLTVTSEFLTYSSTIG